MSRKCQRVPKHVLQFSFPLRYVNFTTTWCSENWLYCWWSVEGSDGQNWNGANRQNKWTFYDQADRKGGRGGISYTGPDRKKMCIFLSFFHWNLILWHSKHILPHCEGSQKFIFHALFVVVKMKGRPLANGDPEQSWNLSVPSVPAV